MTDENKNEETAVTEQPEPKPKKQKDPEKVRQQELRVHRRNGDQSPFKGIRYVLYMIKQVVMFIFFLPYWYNARQAQRIVETGKGSIHGYNNMLYFYPMIPITAICTTLSFAITGALGLQVMGLIWALTLLICIGTAAEDISGRMIGAFFGAVLTIGVSWTVLQASGVVNVNSGLWKFVSFFEPSYARGMTSFLGVGFVVYVTYSLLKSRVHQQLNVHGNRWNPSRLNTEATFDSENHRMYARTPDWQERVLFGCRDLCIVPILAAQDTAELEEHAVFKLQNVPAGGVCWKAIEYSASASEVETPRS